MSDRRPCPDAWGDNDRDARNELRDRADAIERGE